MKIEENETDEREWFRFCFFFWLSWCWMFSIEYCDWNYLCAWFFFSLSLSLCVGVDTHEWMRKMCRFLCKKKFKQYFLAKLESQNNNNNNQRWLCMSFFDSSSLFAAGLLAFAHWTEEKTKTFLKCVRETTPARNGHKQFLFGFVSFFCETRSLYVLVQLSQIFASLPLKHRALCVQTEYHRPYKMSRAFISSSFNYRRQKTFKHGFD